MSTPDVSTFLKLELALEFAFGRWSSCATARNFQRLKHTFDKIEYILKNPQFAAADKGDEENYNIDLANLAQGDPNFENNLAKFKDTYGAQDEDGTPRSTQLNMWRAADVLVDLAKDLYGRFYKAGVIRTKTMKDFKTQLLDKKVTMEYHKPFWPDWKEKPNRLPPPFYPTSEYAAKVILDLWKDYISMSLPAFVSGLAKPESIVLIYDPAIQEENARQSGEAGQSEEGFHKKEVQEVKEIIRIVKFAQGYNYGPDGYDREAVKQLLSCEVIFDFMRVCLEYMYRTHLGYGQDRTRFKDEFLKELRNINTLGLELNNHSPIRFLALRYRRNQVQK